MRIEAERIVNENATAVLSQGDQAIAAGDTQLDLSAVKEVDSAAVALLLHWQRLAQSRDARLELVGAPVTLTGLAQLYGVDELLGLSQPTAA